MQEFIIIPNNDKSKRLNCFEFGNHAIIPINSKLFDLLNIYVFNIFNILETSLRLIFLDGTMSCQELTEEALNVCKLLAIDPNDVILRDISEFNLQGFTEKR